MRIHHLLCATIILSSVAFSQTRNRFQIHPGQTDFTSRGSIGNNPSGGDILQGIHDAHFLGVGGNGGTRVITGPPLRIDNTGMSHGFVVILQDQNTDTQEQYNLVYRTGTDAAGPATGTTPGTGLDCMKGPFTSPPRGGGGLIQAWGITFNWGTAPCEIRVATVPIPGDGFTGIGVNFPTRPPGLGWTNDGISCHMARGDGAFAASRQSTIPASPATDVAWQIIPGRSPLVSHPSIHRTWRFSHMLEAAALQMGNNLASGNAYGKGGSVPLGGSPLNARVRYDASSSGTSFLLVGITRIVPGFGGIQPGMRLYVGPPFVGPLTAPIASGTAFHALGTTPTTPVGATVYFQAGGNLGGPLVLSNGAGVTL